MYLFTFSIKQIESIHCYPAYNLKTIWSIQIKDITVNQNDFILNND